MHLLNNRLGRITALIALGGAALYSQGTQTANVTGLVVDGAGAPIVDAAASRSVGQEQALTGVPSRKQEPQWPRKRQLPKP